MIKNEIQKLTDKFFLKRLESRNCVLVYGSCCICILELVFNDI